MNLKLLFVIIAFLVLSNQSTNSQNNNLLRETISICGSSQIISINNNEFLIQQSIGQASVIGSFSNTKHTFLQGFIRPNFLGRDSSLNTEDLILNLKATIYPNPFRDSVTLLFEKYTEEKISVIIYDLLGRTVFNKKYNSNQSLVIQLQKLPKATYILRVKTSNKQFIKKIIKK